MTATVSAPTFSSRVVNGILAIKPLANLAKNRARQMMIKRADSIGVPWLAEVAALKARNWSEDLAAVQNPNLTYPNYYVTSFHAYEEGNLGWEPALEVEVAAHAVHARIWQEAGANGDLQLRQSYHACLKPQLKTEPQDIVDLGCSVGMSTFALQAAFPHANLTGVDLSPYFLAVAKYRTDMRAAGNGTRLQGTDATASIPTWVHGAAEATGLPDASYDLVSACLLFHELPQTAAIAVFQEARRLLRPGGSFAFMDMNPQSEIYAKMPPYILTLLKSTEPYLDQYFALDVEQALMEAGFERPTITPNSPRHRTVVARVKD
ncbi:MAG: class I SAM-dependent methyltransferase [Oscillatoriales cyanobacterium C42_A2020_001]|nr:class I SAM-dependent methyltransferase [Leptolyngbyaceae cyanobacterium C42_A2020_001]